jgi:uncharacterized protein YhaN
MVAIDTQFANIFDNIKDELDKSEADFKEVQKKLDQDTKERNELNAQIAALKKDNEELRASHSAIDAARKAAEADSMELDKFKKDALTQLDKKAPKNVSFKVVKDAVESVDYEIGLKKQLRDDSQSKLDQMEEKLKSAQSDLLEKEKTAVDYKKQLSSLANEIKAAQSQVANLKNAINLAIKSGQATEGYYFVKQLEEAADGVEKHGVKKPGFKTLVETKYEEGLVNKQRESWKNVSAARKALAEFTDEPDKLRQAAKKAEDEYQKKLKSSESDIKSKLADLAEGEAQPDAAQGAKPVGSPASEPATAEATSKPVPSGSTDKPRSPSRA